MGEKARLMAFKVEDAVTAGQYNYICGFKSQSFERSTNMIDTTIPDCDNPGNPLNKSVRPGIKEYTFEGDGMFENKDSMTIINTAYEAQTAISGKIVVPGLGEFTCVDGYYVNKLSLSGDMEADLEMSIGFEPAGIVVFVPI